MGTWQCNLLWDNREAHRVARWDLLPPRRLIRAAGSGLVRRSVWSGPRTGAAATRNIAHANMLEGLGLTYEQLAPTGLVIFVACNRAIKVIRWPRPRGA